MKKYILCTLFLSFILTWTVKAQTFKVDTLLYNGTVSKRINFVFLGDGYKSTEFAKYITDCQNVMNHLFSNSPFNEYKPYCNVFAVRVPSVQSGTDHPVTTSECGTQPYQNANTYFGSTFDAGGTHRLLVPGSSAVINNVLAANFPSYDQVFMIVNSPYYGGSGGSVATSSTEVNSKEVSLHEIGHSFAALADEYYAGDGYAGEWINMTAQTNPTLVRWKNWYGTQGVGIYQHCCGGNSPYWYRPHQNCKMRALNNPFCAVCKEAIVETIHGMVNPLDSYTPSASSVTITAQSQTFKVTLVKPAPNTLKVQWLLNNVLIAANKDSVVLTAASLITGTNSLTVKVTDTTILSRSNTHAGAHTYTNTWTINPTGGSAIASNKTSYIKGEQMNFNYSGATGTTDWIGIFIQGQSPVTANLKMWAYAPAPGGTKSFSSSTLAAGNYEAYLFCCDGYTVKAKSAAFAIAATGVLPNKSTYTLGEQMSFFYNGASGTTDWIGVFKQGQLPGSVAASVWGYVTAGSGNKILSSSGLTAGVYEAYLLCCDGYTVKAKSAPFQLGSAPPPAGRLSGYDANDIMLSAYPNPFKHSTMMNYQLNHASNVTIKLTDILGKEIILYDNYQNEGYHTLEINTDDLGLTPGMYLVKVSIEGTMHTIKLMGL